MKYLSRIYKQFLELNMRERLLAIAALAGVIYFLFDVALLRPQQTQAKILREQVARQEAELAAFNNALQALSARGQADPLTKQRAERDELRSTIAQAQSVIGRASADVRLGNVIRGLVAATPGLTLVSLKTLPPQTVFSGVAPAATAASGAAPAAVLAMPTLYKHGVEVTLQGKYLALIPYLQGLERSANGIFWNNVKVEVVSYPDATLRMTVYTLSARPELPLG